MNSDNNWKEHKKNFIIGKPKGEFLDEGPDNLSEILFELYKIGAINNQSQPNCLKEVWGISDPNQGTNTNISTSSFIEYNDYLKEKNNKEPRSFDDIFSWGFFHKIDKDISDVIHDISFPNKSKKNYDNQSNNSEDNMKNDEISSISIDSNNFNNHNYNFLLTNFNFENKKIEFKPPRSQEGNNNTSTCNNLNLINKPNPNIKSQLKNTNTLFLEEDLKSNEVNEMQLENKINNENGEKKKGRRKQGVQYTNTEYHGKEETGNATLSIFRSCNKESHNYIWNKIASSIGEDNEKVKIYKNEKSAFEAKFIKIDNEGKKEETIIHIAPPNLKELIANPKDHNNIYYNIKHVIERCKKYLEEESFRTLYENYSWPKRLKKDYKSGNDKETPLEKHKQSMKDLIKALLETEEKLEEKPITALLNLKPEDFMKIFINYDGKENPKKIIRVNYNEYGFNAFDLKDFEVYENCKHKFSDKEKEQNKYRIHMIKILKKKINKRQKKNC